MYVEHRTAARLPSCPNRDDIPEDQLDDFDRALKMIAKHSEGSPITDSRDMVDGQPFAKPYLSAFANAPRVMMRIDDVAYKALYHSQQQPGHFTTADHEMIDLVLGFDSGYWGLHAGHGPNAVAAGIRIEALEALERGREEELSDDEAQVVQFIRAVRDGHVTDEVWHGMVERIGSVSGTIEYACWVCLLFLHHRMMWALGVPAMTQEDWHQMLEDFKSGRRDPEAAASDTVRIARSEDIADRAAVIESVSTTIFRDRPV